MPAIALLAVALAGCSEFQPELLSPAANATAFESRSLADPRLHRFLLATLPADDRAAQASGWNLETFTLAALYYHPDLTVARAKLAGSQAGVITARQRANPTLNLSAVVGSAAVSGAAFPPGVIPVVVGPVVNLLIETFDKREHRTEQAQHLVEAAREDVATASWQVRGRVRTALLNFWAARHRLIFAQEQISLRQQLVALLEQRFAAGDATTPDLARERVALAHATLRKEDVQRLEAEARVQLATAVGIPVSALDGVQISAAAFDHPDLPNVDVAAGPLRYQALTGRSDVQSSLAQYEATQSALQLQIANQYPNLQLSPGYNYEFGTNRFILNPAFDLPIFNQNDGPIAQAIASRQEAAATFTALQARIIGDIDAAAAAYRATTQSLRTADALLASEHVRERQARAAFAAGQSDRPTLVSIELEAAAGRASRFDALVQQRQALGALEDALHQSLFDPEASQLVPHAGSLTATERS